MRLIIASDSTEERHQFRQAALAVGLDCAATDCVSAADLTQRLSHAKADVSIASVGVDFATTLSAVHRISAAGIPTYAVCNPLDESLVPRLLRAGASGYLRRESIQIDLESMLAELRKGVARTAFGRLVAVVGAHGAAGTTTIATNLAFALSSRNDGNVALVQLADGLPDLASHLGLKPDDSLHGLASGWPWLDAASLSRLLIRYPRGPAILADQPSTLAIQWTSVGLRHLLMLLRSQFAFAVVDLGQPADPARMEALRLADAVYLALRLDAPAVASAQALIASLAHHGVNRNKIVAVVNRHGQRGELSWTRVRAHLGLSIGEWIPDDPESVNRAANACRPVIVHNTRVPIAASFARLAAACSPRQRAAG